MLLNILDPTNLAKILVKMSIAIPLKWSWAKSGGNPSTIRKNEGKGKYEGKYDFIP